MKHWVRIVVALIGLAGVGLGAYWSRGNQSSDKPEVVLHSLSGSVMEAATGNPLAGAKVRAYQDSAAPETVDTDSSGDFTFQVRTSTLSLRVTASIDGYEAYDQNVPVSTTSQIRIRLKAKSGQKTSSLPGGQPHPGRHRSASQDLPGRQDCQSSSTTTFGDNSSVVLCPQGSVNIGQPK